ncbi:MAG: FAD-dependent oxidoreductase [Actinomycetota bacterium]|nr:FAD-dependent oxidoreductase [Actinomycetota bacterium]
MTEHIIIGDGSAGTTAAFYIRRHHPEANITIFSEDETPAYYRAALTNYLMGELRPDQLFAVPPNFYQEFNVNRICDAVERIDTEQRRVVMRNTGPIPYDQLLIASGARARKPDFPGNELKGVMAMRTMKDARTVMDDIQSKKLKRAVISGGGILGLEWVAGLRSRKIEVIYVIRGFTFMEGILDQTASDLVISRCRQYGVDVRLDEEVQEILGNNGEIRAVKLKNSGEEVESQLLGWAIGIIPNIEFLEGSGIETRKGIPVDDHMRTNVPNVYAGGDCAEVEDPFTHQARLLGLWEPARHHGRIAGINMSGGDASWKFEVQYNATRVYDLDMAAVGKSIEQPGDEVIVEFPKTGTRISYKKLVLNGNRLVGALLLGDRKEKVRERGRTLRNLIALGADVGPIKSRLLDRYFDLAGYYERLVGTGSPARGKVASAWAKPLTSTAPLQAAAPTGEVAKAPGLSQLMGPEGPRVTTPLGKMQSQGPPAPGVTVPVVPGQRLPGKAPDVSTAVLKLQSGALFELGDRVTIGAGLSNVIQVTGEGVAENHAAISHQPEGFVIANLATSDGTFVNDVPLAGPQKLRHGDVISIGDAHLTFTKQVLSPRADTGPAGLPSEPLKSASPWDQTLGWLEGSRGARYVLTQKQLQIGRDPKECEILVEDPAASWIHAEITRHQNRLYIRDLGSGTGTLLNGELITIPQELKDGAVIRIGATELRFHSGSAQEAEELKGATA